MRRHWRDAVRAALAGLLAAGAVLLALGGPARGGEDARSGAGAAAPAGARQDAFASGRALFARMGCGSCHQLAQGAGFASIGPDLDTVLPNYDARMLRAKIVDPYAAGASASFAQMPVDYGTRMSADELDDLVAFLLATTRD